MSDIQNNNTDVILNHAVCRLKWLGMSTLGVSLGIFERKNNQELAGSLATISLRYQTNVDVIIPEVQAYTSP